MGVMTIPGWVTWAISQKAERLDMLEQVTIWMNIIEA
jgi:hypothetical protein